MELNFGYWVDMILGYSMFIVGVLFWFRIKFLYVKGIDPINVFYTKKSTVRELSIQQQQKERLG